MANENENPTNEPIDLAEGNVVEPQAEVPPVTREEFDGVLARLNETTEMNKRLLNVLEGRQAPAPQPQPQQEPDIIITDEDEGDTRTTKLVQRAMRPLQQQLQQLADMGLNTMSKLSDRSAVASMSPTDRDIYNRYKGDVDRYMSTLNPSLRAQPETLDQVMKLVKADHFDELVNERMEAANRQLVKNARPGAPAPRGGTRDSLAVETNVPTPDDLFGRDSAQARAIEERGGPDQWARRSTGGRCKNWSDYVKLHAKWSGARQ